MFGIGRDALFLIHGYNDQPGWDLYNDGEFVALGDIRNLVASMECYVDTVDLLMCYGAKRWPSENGDSFATVMASSGHIGAVYATPSPYHFNPITNHNYVDEDSIYKYSTINTYCSQFLWEYNVGTSLPIMYRV